MNVWTTGGYWFFWIHPHPVSVTKWGFVGIPYLKGKNPDTPDGDSYWAGVKVRSKICIVLKHIFAASSQIGPASTKDGPSTILQQLSRLTYGLRTQDQRDLRNSADLSVSEVAVQAGSCSLVTWKKYGLVTWKKYGLVWMLGWNGIEKMHEYLYCRYLDIFGKFLVAIVLTLEANFVFKVVCQLCVSSWFRSTSSQSLVNFQSDLAYPWYVETVTSETSKTDTSWISPAFLFKEIIVPFEWYGDDFISMFIFNFLLCLRLTPLNLEWYTYCLPLF